MFLSFSIVKPFVFIVAIALVFLASLYIPSAVDASRAEKIADSITNDSLQLAVRIKELEAELLLIDDTLNMSKSQEKFVDSVYYVSYRYQNTDPHPEISQRRPCPFFVDSIQRRDSTVTIAAYGIYSGGYPPTGTAVLCNDTLLLIIWQESPPWPALGAYFKWTLCFEINVSESESLPPIIVVNRDECYRRREILIREHRFSLLKNVLNYFHSAIGRARRYHPDLSCLSVGCGVQQSYRQFSDTASMIQRKNPQLVDFSYAYPEFTGEEMKMGYNRSFIPNTIAQKVFEDDTLTITLEGNSGWRHRLDGNILIEGDTIFLITWPSHPNEDFAVATFKRQLTYTIAVPKKQWHFRTIDLSRFVRRHKV